MFTLSFTFKAERRKNVQPSLTQHPDCCKLPIIMMVNERTQQLTDLIEKTSAAYNKPESSVKS